MKLMWNVTLLVHPSKSWRNPAKLHPQWMRSAAEQTGVRNVRKKRSRNLSRNHFARQWFHRLPCIWGGRGARWSCPPWRGYYSRCCRRWWPSAGMQGCRINEIQKSKIQVSLASSGFLLLLRLLANFHPVWPEGVKYYYQSYIAEEIIFMN